MLLHIGIFFIALGLYTVLEEFYEIKVILFDKIIIKKKENNLGNYFILKIVVAFFAIIAGILSIANYIIF